MAAPRTGATETLCQIAERLPGSTARFTENMDRNQGRKQPDPARLTPAGRWSCCGTAYGDGVEVGLLPTSTRCPPASA
ncbi:hypothetical protein OHA72_09875 [Dactylosporangium sp. NBC_01737]|uniref:hypothetical protein n=1 Tax=Dactylosporangium sp. NBC_01737 TaxID=2975959 RepID=UPI002E111476|nr:hypothetical protein OHA72_09875 [Dactylosporangium sp. NBC_01737]